ncbi:MAG: pentapeptide repeat-containing protein [Bacteriovoracia bacterium]
MGGAFALSIIFVDCVKASEQRKDTKSYRVHAEDDIREQTKHALLFISHVVKPNPIRLLGHDLSNPDQIGQILESLEDDDLGRIWKGLYYFNLELAHTHHIELRSLDSPNVRLNLKNIVSDQFNKTFIPTKPETGRLVSLYLGAELSTPSKDPRAYFRAAMSRGKELEHQFRAQKEKTATRKTDRPTTRAFQKISDRYSAVESARPKEEEGKQDKTTDSGRLTKRLPPPPIVPRNKKDESGLVFSDTSEGAVLGAKTRKMLHDRFGDLSTGDDENRVLGLVSEGGITILEIYERLARAKKQKNNIFKDFSQADARGLDFTKLPQDSMGDPMSMRESNFHQAQLQRAKFDSLSLEKSVFAEVVFNENTSFRKAGLNSANFSMLKTDNGRSADFSEAHLYNATFEDADLRYANFRKADLARANFIGANLAKADLSEADLRGADLSSVRGLGSAKLAGARMDSTTKLPASFSPEVIAAMKVKFDPCRPKLLRRITLNRPGEGELE